MCTAISFSTPKHHYFGRNLDYEYSYQETVTVTPRAFPLRFRKAEALGRLAMIGMAFVQNGYPLYYDATNEAGLSVAGLNFPQNAAYLPFAQNKINLAPFEFIPFLLRSCKSVDEAAKLLQNVNLWCENFSPDLPCSPLHFLISDNFKSLVAEPSKEGLLLFDNPVGVLTNNPPFPFHMMNLRGYMSLGAADPVNNFCKDLPLTPYSRGMGALGLPGDLSSPSRFIKATFTKCNSRHEDSERENVCQFFHILSSVAQQKGCCKVEKGYEYTIYSSCCDTARGVYYYTTYLNPTINGVDMHAENLEGDKLVSYPLMKEEKFRIQNER